MRDFIITNIEWDDESKTSGEVYIADEAMGDSWVLVRKYLTVKEAQEKILVGMPQGTAEHNSILSESIGLKQPMLLRLNLLKLVRFAY